MFLGPNTFSGGMWMSRDICNLTIKGWQVNYYCRSLSCLAFFAKWNYKHLIILLIICRTFRNNSINRLQNCKIPGMPGTAVVSFFILFSLWVISKPSPEKQRNKNMFFLGFKTSNDQKPPIPPEMALKQRHERCELLPRNHSHIVTMWIRKVSFSQAWCNWKVTKPERFLFLGSIRLREVLWNEIQAGHCLKNFWVPFFLWKNFSNFNRARHPMRQ